MVCSQTDGTTHLSIYSLSAPAAPVTSLTQEFKEPHEEASSWHILLYIIKGIAVVVGIVEDEVPYLVPFLILKGALVNVEHFVESPGDMEAESIAGVIKLPAAPNVVP